MARSRSASRGALGAAIAAMLAASCRLFVDLDGLQGGAAPDAGNDAQPPPIDAPGDAPPADAPADSPPFDAGDAGNDVDAAAPCGTPTVLVGSNVVFGKTMDSTGSRGVDAVGFTSSDGGVARCAWIYVVMLEDASPATTTIALGVYANGAGDAPETRLAQATVTSLVPGWNHAPLDAPVALAGGEDVWLSYAPSAGAIVTEVSATCGARLYQHTDANDAGGAPPVFVTTNTFLDTCDTAIYLGP